MKMTIMVGLPASGKSTLAKSLMERDGNTVRINKDLLRTMLHFDKWNGKLEVNTRDAAESIADVMLRNEINVIIDDTNLNPKTLEVWKSIAKERGAKIQYVRMETPLELCLLRDEQREKHVGENVIIGMALQYGLYPKPEKPIVICDIDGTLANIDHRLHYVKGDKKDWDGFFTHMMSDIPRTEVVDMILKYEEAGHEIFFVSARPDNYRAFTEDWIVNKAFNGYKPHKTLFMRRAGDTREDSEIKKGIYSAYFKDLPIETVIDDRPRVIRMWRELGLNVIDVGSGVEF
jgi:predicted kinase